MRVVVAGGVHGRHLALAHAEALDHDADVLFRHLDDDLFDRLAAGRR